LLIFGFRFPLFFRRKQLENLLRCYEEHENEIISALEADLRRPKQESLIVETEFMKNDIRHILFQLDEWVQSEKVSHSPPYTLLCSISLMLRFLAFCPASRPSRL